MEPKIIELHKNLSEKIINTFYKVYNNLGYGFLEKVYENALKIEIQSSSMEVKAQQPITVFYDRYEVGKYFADLLVEDKIIIELKAVETLCKEHENQLLNYLKATKYEVGLLLNFGKERQVKRRIYTNNYKKIKAF